MLQNVKRLVEEDDRFSEDKGLQYDTQKINKVKNKILALAFKYFNVLLDYV